MRKILFAASSCYLDDSNGATVASRAMIEALARRGFAVAALSSTTLEVRGNVDPDTWLAARGDPYSLVAGSLTLDAGGVRFDVPSHYVIRSNGVPVTLHRSHSISPHSADQSERDEFLRLFDMVWDRFQPDLVVNYGGDLLAHEIRSRSRRRGGSVVFSLHNFSYRDVRCFASADAVVVPSEFAARYYRDRLGLDCSVLPNLVDRSRAVASNHDRRYLTFVNPCAEKGVFVFTRIADELGRRRPDIPLLVIESRGSESTLVGCGLDLRVHGNVFLMENTSDPRRFWGVTKVCLMPSLWLENQPLVAIEAMINGIPVIGTDRGGIPETLGNAGVILPLPERLTPFARELPTVEEVAPWVDAIIRLWDDSEWYAEQSQRALAEAQRWAPDVLEPQHVQFFESLKRTERL